MIRSASALTPAVGLQISFNEDYTVLYGHNYDDGKWYEINTGNGDLTDLSFTTLVPGTSKGFRDLGGASVISVPEPATTGLMLAGAAFIGSEPSRAPRAPRSPMDAGERTSRETTSRCAR